MASIAALRKRNWILLISCEHGGKKVPAHFLKMMNGTQQKDLATHKGWDPGALIVAKHIAQVLRSPLFFTETSRLLVDCNRSAHHPLCLGPAFRGLEKAEKQFILAEHYWPHRNAIEKEILRIIQQGSSVLHLAIHSFTPVLSGEVRNAEIGLLYDPGRPSEKHWSDYLLHELKEDRPDLRMRRNYPYQGKADGLTTWLRKHYGSKDYAGIEIELNQALLKQEKSTTLIKQSLTRCVHSALIQHL